MFVIDIPYFNLDHIYNSGQAPRWIKLRDSKYVIPHKDKVLKIEQIRDRYDWTKYRLIFGCTEDDFFNVWFKYFDLQTDYFEENKKIKKLGGKFKVIANRGFGIHILNQDPFEAYVFSKIATNAGYEKARVAMNHIAEVCGTSHTQAMREAGKITWYEFPTPEMILEKFDELKKMGKINAWLKRLCEAIVHDDYAYSYPGNWNDLCKLYVNDKTVFPLVGIEETLSKNFDCEPVEFADWHLDNIKNKGLVYSYILHHVKNPPEEVLTRGFSR